MAAAKKQQRTAAEQYAQAVLDLANERQEAEAVGAELTQVRQMIFAEPLFGLFLKDPGISVTQRQQVLDNIFRGRLSGLVFNTLGVLNGKNRLALLPLIVEAYLRMLDRQFGRIQVKVTVAQAMDGAMTDDITARISAAFKKQAQVSQSVDESIIGGMILRIDDKLIDGSVKTQLQRMKAQLMASAPRA